MPLVSVILPTHNRAGRVGTAIASVLRQREADLELIVVDDGSTDGTSEILEANREMDGRIRSIRLPAPGGAAHARNRGVAESDSEFVAFLDDDDEWLPSKTADQVAFLREEPRINVVSTDYAIVVPDGRTAVYRGPARCTTRAMWWANFPGGCSFVMVRRTALPDGPAFDDSVVPCEDWDLWLRAAGGYGAAAIPRIGCRYVAHAGTRLTGTSERRSAGSEAFVRKWWEAMSADQRAYHSAVLRLIETEGFSARMKLRASLLRTTPLRVSAVIARTSIATRVGRMLGDPGRAARSLLAAIGEA